MLKSQKVEAEVVEDEDDAGYHSPGFITACLAVNLNDVHPGPGLCNPKFHASLEHHDIRDNPEFTTYFLVLADEHHGGGVYIDKDDLGWSLQGINPKPKVLQRTSWRACVSSWQNMCRLALHSHTPPKAIDDWLARSISPSAPTTSCPPLLTASSSFSSSTSVSQTAPTSSGKSRSAAPTRDTTRDGSSTRLASPVVKPVLRSATPLHQPSRDLSPVTPTATRAPWGAAAESSPIPAIRAPSSAPIRGLKTPQKLLFASRGATPEGGVVTSSPKRAEQLLEEHGEVFISRSHSGLAQAVDYLFEVGILEAHEVFSLQEGQQLSGDKSPIAVISVVRRARRKGKSVEPEAVCTAHVRGRTPWALGTKRVFMLRFFPQWSCLSRRKRGPFYDHVVCAFIAKYGMYFDVTTDLEEDIDDPDPTGDEIDHTTYSPEECLLRTVYTDSLRTRISQWFRDEEQRITKAEADEVDITKILDSHVATTAPTKTPANLRITHYYSSHHYTTRVKATFEPVWAAAQAEWAAKCKAWKEAGVPICTDEEPAEVAIRTRITNECWERESESFRALVTLAHDQEKEAKRAAREAAAQAPSGPVVLRTPQDYQRAIDNAAVYIQPTADAFAAKLGMLCVVLLVGPLPEEGGAIGMVSIHSGELPGGIQWFDFDRQGYALTERSLIGFGEQVFSKQERAKRAINHLNNTVSTLATTSGTTSRIRSPSQQPQSSRAASIRVLSSWSDSHSCAAPSQTLSPSAIFGLYTATVSRAFCPSYTASYAHVVAYSHVAAPVHFSGTFASSRAITLSRAISFLCAIALLRAYPSSCTIAFSIAFGIADFIEGDAHVVWSTTSTNQWPLHIRDAFAAFMQGRHWGTSFADAVQAFLQLEGSFGFPLISDDRRLIAGSLRPSAYLHWEKLGRSYEQLIGIDDVAQYSRKYWLWWEAVQPARRLPEDKLLPIEQFEDLVGGMEDWDGLDKCCGKDGLIQALMMLFWWGGAVNLGGGHCTSLERWIEWDSAVRDFGDILALMMRTPGFEKVARKRTRTLRATTKDGDGTASSKKRAHQDLDTSNGLSEPSKRSRKASIGKTSHTRTALTGKAAKKRKASLDGGGQTKRRPTTLSAELVPSVDIPSADLSTPSADIASAVDAGPARALRDRTKLVKTFKARPQE
uniref:Uncharacterized protein n=1 Tax=Schizophyllum commune (strain H4-8 / FGSC 9210) TaxID=578458 RepID=D8PLA6_SCHCM